MNNRVSSWLSVTLMLFMRVALGQGFVNLDFESAVLVRDSSYEYYASSAIAGWTGYLGTNQVTDVYYGLYPLGEASIGLISKSLGVEGQYGLMLQSGADPSAPENLIGASVSQSGLIPADAQSLRFRTPVNGSGISVSLGGQPLSLVSLAETLNYRIYGADISPFAGQVQTLTFAVQAGRSGAQNFDSVAFSPLAVPEPGTVSLLSTGLLILCWGKMRPNHRRQRTPRGHFVCISREWRGAAAADR